MTRLPKIQEELVNAIQETDARLRGLPKAPSSDPVGEVMHNLRNFVRDLDRRVEGTPEEDGLLQTIRPHQEAFKVAIRRTAPHFVPWEKTKIKELREASFLAHEDGADAEEESRTNQSKIYIDEVLKRAQE